MSQFHLTTTCVCDQLPFEEDYLSLYLKPVQNKQIKMNPSRSLGIGTGFESCSFSVKVKMLYETAGVRPPDPLTTEKGLKPSTLA